MPDPRILGLYHQFRSYKEVAKALAIPMGTVRSRINRARIAALQPDLRKYWQSLPIELRRRWWRETDYGRLGPSDSLLQEIRRVLSGV